MGAAADGSVVNKVLPLGRSSCKQPAATFFEDTCNTTNQLLRAGLMKGAVVVYCPVNPWSLAALCTLLEKLWGGQQNINGAATIPTEQTMLLASEK